MGLKRSSSSTPFRGRSSTIRRGNLSCEASTVVVFVADSQWEKMEENVGSFRNLEQNLQKQNLPLDQVPIVLQFNKRDLPNVAPVNYLEYLLNNRKRRVQSFDCVASTGANVFSALDAVTQLLLHKFKRENTSLFPGPGKQTAR